MKPPNELCQELCDALKIWDQMNDDLEAMRGTVTKAQHAAQRLKIEKLVWELESRENRKAS